MTETPKTIPVEHKGVALLATKQTDFVGPAPAVPAVVPDVIKK